MISKSLKHNSNVFHEHYGFGVFKGFNETQDCFNGWALVEFENLYGVTVTNPKKLIEIEGESNGSM